MIDDLFGLVPAELLSMSGRVFYSGRSAFERPNELYLLGLNPGGDPVRMADSTIADDIDRWRRNAVDWSAYQNESWNDRQEGKHKMQRRVLHLLSNLSRQPSAVPASNVVFVRSRRERDLAANKARLLDLCWPLHQAVIERLGVKTVVCFGQTAGLWVREKLGAERDTGNFFVERNSRKWVSRAHQNKAGLAVLTLTHPSIAAWQNRDSDPSGLVAGALAADAPVN